MKTIPVSYLVAGMLLPIVSLAQPPERPLVGPGRDGPPRHWDKGPDEMWKKVDKDGDGFLSFEEFSAMPRIDKLPEEKQKNLFSRLDKDGDGKLGRQELWRLGRHPDGGRPMKRLWELDVDKSGGVSLEEFKAGEMFKRLPPEKIEELFRKLDTDGDGLITPKDRPKPPFKRPDGKGPDRPDRFGPDGKPDGPRGPKNGKGGVNWKLDENRDGVITFEEFRRGPAIAKLSEDEQEDRFEKLDRNKDLKITREDFGPPPPSG